MTETIAPHPDQRTRDLAQKFNVVFNYPQTSQASWNNKQRGNLRFHMSLWVRTKDNVPPSCSGLLAKNNNLSFLQWCVVTGDEKWVLHYKWKWRRLWLWEASVNIKTKTPSTKVLALYLGDNERYHLLQAIETRKDHQCRCLLQTTSLYKWKLLLKVAMFGK